MTKENLRKLFLQKRLAMSAGDYQAYNEKIAKNFFHFVDLSGIGVVHSFLPIEKTKEPDTWMIINRLKKEFPSIKVSVPRINNETTILDNFYYEESDQLEKNLWGIPEPKYGVPTPIEKIDLVLIPMLAIDKRGHRVGYGRGFYDKFLKQCRPDVKKVGVCFFPPVDQIDDVKSFDEVLDAVVTPDQFEVFDSPK